MKTLSVVVIVGALCAAGCGATAPASQERELIEGPVRMAVGVHKYWGEGVEFEVPEALAVDLDAAPRWVAHVAGGVDYELWPGGVRVENARPRWGVRVVGWDPERGTARVTVFDGSLVFFPIVERGALISNVTNQPAVVYNDRGLPFARFPRATVVDPTPGGQDDDRFAYVCLGGDVCWGRGYVKRSNLGDIIPIAEVLDEVLTDNWTPEPLASVPVPQGREITLYDDGFAPTVSGEFEMLDVLERGEEWSIVSTYHDGVELYGHIKTSWLTELEEEGVVGGMLGGMGMGGMGRGRGGRDTPRVRLDQGAWIHGAPASAAKFARVDAESMWVYTQPGDADGWTAGTISTPWGRFTVYVRDADIAERKGP